MGGDTLPADGLARDCVQRGFDLIDEATFNYTELHRALESGSLIGRVVFDWRPEAGEELAR